MACRSSCSVVSFKLSGIGGWPAHADIASLPGLRGWCWCRGWPTGEIPQSHVAPAPRDVGGQRGGLRWSDKTLLVGQAIQGSAAINATERRFPRAELVDHGVKNPIVVACV